MREIILKIRQYFCKHQYDYENAKFNRSSFEWEISDCNKCGKVWKSGIPKFENPPPLPPHMKRRTVPDITN